jgi:hypothetical protein
MWFASKQGTFNAMFNLPPDSAVAVIVIMAFILIFEWVGGLSSVAFLTDCSDSGYAFLVYCPPMCNLIKVLWMER